MRRRSSSDKKGKENDEGDSEKSALDDELLSLVEEDESQYTLRTGKNPSTKAGNLRKPKKSQQPRQQQNAKKAQQAKREVESDDSSDDLSSYLPNQLDVSHSDGQNHSEMREISRSERVTQERIIAREEYVEVKDVGTQADLAFQSQNIKILQIREENGVELMDVLELGHLRSYKREYMEANHIKSLIRFYESISRCNLTVNPSDFQTQPKSKN